MGNIISAPTNVSEISVIGLYEHFLIELESLTSKNPLSADEIKDNLDIERSQCEKWLRRAKEEGLVERKIRPVRYQLSRPRARQPDLFEE